VRQSRIAIVVLLLTAGVLGVYWFAAGQEGRAPWPPPPVKFEEPSNVLPPVPATGSAPAAPADSKSRPSTPAAAASKVIGGVLPGSASEVKQVVFRGDSDPPPPSPPKLTIPPPAAAPANSAKAVWTVPVMPDVPSSGGPAVPVLPKPVAAKPTPATLVPMPAADPTKVDPTKSVITDPVKDSLPPLAAAVPAQPGNGKPPAFVLIKPNAPDGQRATADALPSIPTPPGPLGNPQVPSDQQTMAKSVQASDSGPAAPGVQTPPVTVEKRAMAPARAGEPQSFQVIVRNRGTIVAEQVNVEELWPTGVKLLQADPMPTVESVMQGSHATWVVNELAPGGVRVLNVTLQSAAAIESACATRLHVLTTAGSHTPPAPPAPVAMRSSGVVVQVAAPAGVAVGRPAVFEVTYSNTGRQRVSGLVLHAALSDGLRHPVGQNIEADVGDLDPGASKTVKVTASAVQPGRQAIQVQIKGPGGSEASAQAGLDVVPAAPALNVQQAPAIRLYPGRTTDLRIEVTNNTNKPMRHVAVASFLPEGVDFLTASDQGNFQPNARTVNWLLDPLAPGQMQPLFIRVQASGQGQLTHLVTARADGVPEMRSTGTLSVEGHADLSVVVKGENSVEVGKEVVYEVRVANPGSGPNTNVRLEVSLSPGLLPRNAKGPTPFRIDSQTVVFEGLSPLAPQGQVVYHILAVGQSPGDSRVRATVTSDQVRTPVVRETPTRVYRD
jgi:hypothetical protein